MNMITLNIVSKMINKDYIIVKPSTEGIREVRTSENKSLRGREEEREEMEKGYLCDL